MPLKWIKQGKNALFNEANWSVLQLYGRTYFPLQISFETKTIISKRRIYMNRFGENYLKQMIEVTGSDNEFVLTLGGNVHYHGNLEDRAVNNMERWGLSEICDDGTPMRAMTYRFDFSVNEAEDLRAVAELFIERLGIADYRLDVIFS